MLLYTDVAQLIVSDLCRRLPDFAHIDPRRVGVLAAARSASQRTGNLAMCCGLRAPSQPTFAIWTRRRTRRVVKMSRWFRHVSPRIELGGAELRYLILLRLPRMLLSDPLETLVHELFHIGLSFDGRMRGMRHGPGFDREVRRIAAQWQRRLSDGPERELGRLARMPLADLEAEFGAILGLAVPAALTLPITEEVAAPPPDADALRAHHPGYTLDPGCEIVAPPLTPARAPRKLTEDDLELRHYRPGRSRKMPRAMLRYSRRVGPLAA